MSLYSTLLPAACPPAGLVPARAKPRAVEHSKLQATPGRGGSPAGAAIAKTRRSAIATTLASTMPKRRFVVPVLCSLLPDSLPHWCYLYSTSPRTRDPRRMEVSVGSTSGAKEQRRGAVSFAFTGVARRRAPISRADRAQILVKRSPPFPSPGPRTRIFSTPALQTCSYARRRHGHAISRGIHRSDPSMAVDRSSSRGSGKAEPSESFLPCYRNHGIFSCPPFVPARPSLHSCTVRAPWVFFLAPRTAALQPQRQRSG